MTKAALAIDTRREDATAILELRGELDIATAPVFAQRVMRVLSSTPQELVLDIGELEFVDSTGLRAILAAKALCSEHGCGFATTRSTRQVERVFELTRVLDHLRFRSIPREIGAAATGALDSTG
jgi:anti-anti-sigma factor